MDDIKLPPMPDDVYDISGPIWRCIVEWSSAEPGKSGSDAADAIDAAITRVMHNYARETVRLNATVPDGWKLVPMEPTQEMCSIDFDCDDSIGIDSARICYKAMVVAAPAAPQEANDVQT